MPENQIESAAVLIQNGSDILSGLRDETRLTTALAVMAEGHERAIVLASFPGKGDHIWVPRVGFHFHLHCTAPGKAMLAFEPKDLRQTILARLTYSRLTKRSPQSAGILEPMLDECVRRGFALDVGEFADGINCVASCIRDENGKPLAAIWITAHAIELPEKDLNAMAKKVVRAAKEIERRLSANNPDTSPYVNEALGQAKAFIDDNFTDEAAIHQFIEGLFMSQSWFRARFRATYGISPMHYRQKLVFEKAERLLELTSLPIKEVASQLGFESQSYFSRAFKKRFGLSPGLFRERQSNSSSNESPSSG